MKFAQSCPTLCDSMDFIIHGILQVRILEWVAFPFSKGLPNPGIELRSPSLQADVLPSEPPGKSSLIAQLVKNPPAMKETLVRFLGWEDWRRERLPTPVFWPRIFHGLCSPWSRKESDTTHTHARTHTLLVKQGLVLTKRAGRSLYRALWFLV